MGVEKEVLSVVSELETEEVAATQASGSHSSILSPQSNNQTCDGTNATTLAQKLKGVVQQQNGHWGAQIYANHRRIWLGTFKSDEEAAMAYDSAAIKLGSMNRHRNFPLNQEFREEHKFQSRLSTEAVLAMIKDGTYRDKLSEYLSTMSPDGPKNEPGYPSIVPSRNPDRFSFQQLFQKELTPSDVGKLNRLVIPKKFAIKFFPRISQRAEVAGLGTEGLQLVFYDRGMRSWNFRYCYWSSSHSFVFTKGWNFFVKNKELSSGDVVGFYECLCHDKREGKTFWMIDVVRRETRNVAVDGKGTVDVLRMKFPYLPVWLHKSREGLVTYKQFIQELEDDVLPSEAEHRYLEYKTEYTTTQKRTYFGAHKDEEWLRGKYHPTNLVAVIERRNELARQAAKEFLLELQSGTLELGPGLRASSSKKSGHGDDANSDVEADACGKRRHQGRGSARDTDLSPAPKAHPISSDARRIQVVIEQSQSLVHKLDSEKGVEDNILVGTVNDKTAREKAHGASSGPVIIIRSLTSVKGLEGIDLLETLLTYLWRIHGLDYYGMKETGEAQGLRHVRAEGKNSDPVGNGSEWEKKLGSRWQERLSGQDPLEIRTAKEKIDAAAVDVLDPHVRKIRDEKYGWKYGCGAKGCTKLFHASEFVHKHLKLKHPELLMELTSKLREDLYFQNYMNDPDAPGGTPVMQVNRMRDRPQRRRLLENRLRDERGLHIDRENQVNGERFGWSDNPQPGDMKDGTGGDGDEAMFDSFGGPGIQAPFGSDFPPPPVLMPVPGAGPLGPFVPAPPEVAMQMFRDQGEPPFEGGGRNRRLGPQLNGPAQIIGSFPGFQQDPRRLRSYQDLDAPDDEVTVIDYRSL